MLRILAETSRNIRDVSDEDPAAPALVAKAVLYLDGRGILEHHADHPHLARWEQDDDVAGGKLREARRLTQVNLAEALKINQEAVSMMEKRADM